MDFGALSCATNLCKTLGKLGCMHFVGLKGRREFEGPSELSEPSGEVTKSIRNFMKYFWFKFGRADVGFLAEGRRTAVRILSIFVCIVIFLSFVVFFVLVLMDFSCACVGFTEGQCPVRPFRDSNIEDRRNGGPEVICRPF